MDEPRSGENALTCKAVAETAANNLHHCRRGAAHSANPSLWFPLRFLRSNLDLAGTDILGSLVTILGHFGCHGPTFEYFDDCT